MIDGRYSSSPDARRRRPRRQRVVGRRRRRVASQQSPARTWRQRARHPRVRPVAEELERLAVRRGHRAERERARRRGAVAADPLGERADAAPADAAGHAPPCALPGAVDALEQVDGGGRAAGDDTHDLLRPTPAPLSGGVQPGSDGRGVSCTDVPGSGDGGGGGAAIDAADRGERAAGRRPASRPCPR